MIEIDYEIKIDFGSEGVKTFKPGYPNDITKPYAKIIARYIHQWPKSARKK